MNPVPLRLCRWAGPLSRRLLAAGLVGFSAGILVGEESPAAGPIVELPKFVVTDNRELPPPESWRYGSIPGFEILTNASDKATKRLIADFQLFRLGLSYVWPLPERPAFPVSLIICGRGAKFSSFVPKEQMNYDMARASLLLKRGDRSGIVIDFQSSVLNILSAETDSAASGTDSSQLAVDHSKQLYREYIRYLLSQSEPRLPAWFEEGLSQIIMGMHVEPTLIEFGRVEDPNLVSAAAAQVAEMNALNPDPDSPLLPGAPSEDRDFNAALARRPLMSLDKMFAVEHSNALASNPLGNNIWAKQCYAFVHMCLYGENGKYNKQFSTFLLRAAKEPVTEAMFRECFRFPQKNGPAKEMGFKDMLMALRGYINFTVYKVQGFRAEKGSKGFEIPPPIALRDATQSEIGRIKGEVMLLAGHQDKARTELLAPYIRGERDAALLGALGVFERQFGQEDRARKLLEAAVAAKTPRPDAYLELARYRQADALAKPAGRDGKLSDEQVNRITTPLLASRSTTPALPGTYELLADVWLRGEKTRTKEEIAVLLDGLRVFPGRLKLAYQTAVLAYEAQIFDTAHLLADHGLKYARDSVTKDRFTQLKATLPSVAPASARTGDNQIDRR